MSFGAIALQWFGVVLILGAAFMFSTLAGLAAFGALCIVCGLVIEREVERAPHDTEVE
jgi:hypothetical protein